MHQERLLKIRYLCKEGAILQIVSKFRTTKQLGANQEPFLYVAQQFHRQQDIIFFIYELIRRDD